MSKRHHHDQPRPRLSPTTTLADASDDFMAQLEIPDLPGQLPERLTEALGRRVDALLYQLERARHERWIDPLEVRLVRDAHCAVVTAWELGLHDGEVHYARFRDLVEALGYERTDVGFRKVPPAL